MRHTLAVSHWRKVAEGDDTVVSASIGDAVVQFRGTALADAPERGDPWLAVALHAAMAAGVDLDLRDLPPVSARLLQATDTIQELWTAWNPWLTRITVLANTSEEPAPRPTGSATCFSGGFDAIHAALEGGEPGQQLLFVDGLDHAMADAELAEATPRLHRLATALGGQLVTIRTNWIHWRRGLHLSASLTHGGVLAACAHLLAPSRLTIGSSNSFARLTPWGTHPLADRWWSSEETLVRHWGCHRTRAEKVMLIARRPDLLAEIRVCHHSTITNCGRCPKCIRTRAMLRLLGTDLPDLAPGSNPDPIAEFTRLLRVGSERVYAEEVRELAASVGDTKTVQLMTNGIRAVNRRHLLRDIVGRLLPAIRRRREGDTDLLPWGYGPLPASW